MLRHQVVRHGSKAIEALDRIVKDQLFPQGLAVGGAEKGVMPFLGDIYTDHQYGLIPADGTAQLVEPLQPVFVACHEGLLSYQCWFHC
jgi:hypothetical protein